MNAVQGRITLVTNGHPLHEVAIKSLAGYLGAKGVACRSVYLNHAAELTAAQRAELMGLCDGAALVGFSLMSKDVKTLRPVAAEVRGKGIPVVWGGIHATAMPEESLRECDFACVGEGELSLHRLYTSLCQRNSDFSAIPNLAYVADGQVRLPRVFHSEASLDALPFPDYEFKDAYMRCQDGRIRQIPGAFEERRRFFGGYALLFYSQRGCPFSCTYCSNSLYHGIAGKTGVGWYRTASPARVKAELVHHLRFIAVRDALNINDDDFVMRPIEELDEIGAFIKHELGLGFNINATPSAVTREKIAVLAKYGLRQVAMGVQTGAARILKHVYRRSVTPEQVLKAAHIIDAFSRDGVTADYGFILENPYEGAEDHRDSLRLMLALPRPFNVSLYSLAFFPGTVLTQRALAEKVIRSDQVALDKDYRETIRPSFVHMLFEANYRLQVPAEINDILLSDNVMVSERKQYARMLLANYFISDALKRILGSDAPRVMGTNGAAAKVVEFLNTVAEVLKNWCEPTTVVQPVGGQEDLILQYAGGAKGGSGTSMEIGFNNGRIVRVEHEQITCAPPANALTG
jgi:anaerobic magnesium-protoporphyrin IX monomethyl ester cyclase